MEWTSSDPNLMNDWEKSVRGFHWNFWSRTTISIMPLSCLHRSRSCGPCSSAVIPSKYVLSQPTPARIRWWARHRESLVDSKAPKRFWARRTFGPSRSTSRGRAACSRRLCAACTPTPSPTQTLLKPMNPRSSRLVAHGDPARVMRKSRGGRSDPTRQE